MYTWLKIDTKIVSASGSKLNVVHMFLENLFQKQKAKNK